MTTKRYTLSKEERLSWKRYIDLLFEKGQSFVAFPLRVVYLPMEEEMPARASFLVSVPKKKFKRAVKRNDRYVRLTGFVNMIYWNRWKRRIRAC